MQEKQLQRPFKSTETHWNSSYYNIFLMYSYYFLGIQLF